MGNRYFSDVAPEKLDSEGSKATRGMTLGKKINMGASFREVTHKGKPKAAFGLPKNTGFKQKKG